MKKNIIIKTREIKKTVIGMAMALVMGGTLLAQSPVTGIVAHAECPVNEVWTDAAPTTCGQQYKTRTLYRSKKVSYTTSTTDSTMDGWTLYNTDSKVVGKGDKIEYGRGNDSTAPAKSGAYRVWAEKINYTYNPDIYTRPTTDISIVTTSSETNKSKIKWIQIALCRYGYNSPVDGVYGSATFAYVKKFQQDNGITATGIFGRATIQKMTAKIDSDPVYCYYYETAAEQNTYHFYKLDAQWSDWTETAITGDTTFNAGVTNVMVETKKQYCYITPAAEEESDDVIEAPEIKKINFKSRITKVQLADDPDADGYECTVLKVSVKSLKLLKKQLNECGDDTISVKGTKTFTSKSAFLSLKNLKKGKKYAMVARSFKYVDGEKLYSNYSSIKIVKIKK